MDFKDIKSDRHYLYDNLNEFKAFVQDIVVIEDWRQGMEGDWILTDDDYVCQVLRMSKIGKSKCIRTLCGTFNVMLPIK